MLNPIYRDEEGKGKFHDDEENCLILSNKFFSGIFVFLIGKVLVLRQSIKKHKLSLKLGILLAINSVHFLLCT